jgi:hypothetical protein
MTTALLPFTVRLDPEGAMSVRLVAWKRDKENE